MQEIEPNLKQRVSINLARTYDLINTKLSRN